MIDQKPRALIVHGDKDQHARWLQGLSHPRFAEPLFATDFQQAFALLESDLPAIVVVFVDSLVDGVWLAALAPGFIVPSPRVFAVHSGALDPQHAWLLGTYGTRLIHADRVLETLSRELDGKGQPPLPELAPILVQFLGRKSLFDVEEKVRAVLVEQAVLLARHNKSQAASLLQVPRQLVQRHDPARPPRRPAKPGKPGARRRRR